MADRLRECTREHDTVARIGGDEFVILQIRIPEDTLSASIDRLQETLGKHNLQSKKPYKLSLSLGSVVYNPADATSLEQLLAEADVKMYEHKKSKNIQNKG